MKKVLFVFLALALLAPGVFAADKVGEFFSLGTWGRSIWNVAAATDDNVVSSLGQSWSGQGPLVGVTISGRSDFINYVYDVCTSGLSFDSGSNVYMEVTPFDWLKSAVGRMFTHESRSDGAYGIWNFYRMGTLQSPYAGEEGFIMDCFLDIGNCNEGGNHRGGLNARFYPIDGLTVAVAVPLLFSNGYSESNVVEEEETTSTGTVTDLVLETTTYSAPSFRNVFGNANAYAAYTIDGIGRVRLAWDGRTGDKSREAYENENSRIWGLIEAAFELNLAALPDLYVSIGAKIPTITQKDASYALPYQANLYARYRLDIAMPITFNARFGSAIMAHDSYKDDYNAFGFLAGLGISCEVLENVPVFVDVSYANGVYMNGSSADGEDCWTFGVGITKAWANAEIGIAFIGATNGYGLDYMTHAGNEGKFAWTIPLKYQIAL